MTARLFGAKLLKHAILVIGSIITGFPFLWMISNSLMANQQIFRFPPNWLPRPAHWVNYARAFEYLQLRSFLNSLLFTAGVTGGIILLSLMSAFVFAKLRLPKKNLLFLLYVASLMLPWQVTIVPQFIIVARLQWVDTFQGLIVPYLAQISVGTFFFRQFFMKVPQDLYDASKIDGCAVPDTFIRIYIPVSLPAIAAFSIVTALSAWNQYMWPLIVTASREMQTLTVALGVLSTTKSASMENVGMILAASFLSIVPLLVIYMVAQRWFVEGISTTGLKF
jgi:multiple sugar transport system permease protein